jgi:hypothetical protein
VLLVASLHVGAHCCVDSAHFSITGRTYLAASGLGLAISFNNMLLGRFYSA